MQSLCSGIKPAGIGDSKGGDGRQYAQKEGGDACVIPQVLPRRSLSCTLPTLGHQKVIVWTCLTVCVCVCVCV